MARPLSIDDFKLFRAVCELRYRDAYLVYDRTGQIISDIRGSFTDVGVTNPSPSQTLFNADEGSFSIEINKSSFTSDAADAKLEKFGSQCKVFFDAVAENLKISVFTRIGLRIFMRKEFKNLEDGIEALGALDLLKLGDAKRFNISNSPSEVLLRWEDKSLGAIVRLKPERTELTLTTPREFDDHMSRITKVSVGLTLDIDYYTVAPVERDQWDAVDWIPPKMRIIRREADAILQGGVK